MTRMVLVLVAAATGGFGPLIAQNATLEAAARVMGGNNQNSVQVIATGSSHAFGQAFKPGGPWPAFKVTSFTQTINFADPSMRIELERTNPDGAIQGGGGLPLAASQKQVQAVNGRAAWNIAASGTATPAPNTADDRLLMIWMSPMGVIRAAQQNNATVSGRTIAFTTQGRNIKATLNADNTVQKVETVIDTPGNRRHRAHLGILSLQGFQRLHIPGPDGAASRRASHPGSDRLRGAPGRWQCADPHPTQCRTGGRNFRRGIARGPNGHAYESGRWRALCHWGLAPQPDR